MSISFEGIGAWMATFCCDGLSCGDLVTVCDNGEVEEADAGDRICGVVAHVSGNGDACSVQLGGVITTSYSGTTAPAVGYSAMVADGSGGMKVLTGSPEYLVVSVDATAKTVTFVL